MLFLLIKEKNAKAKLIYSARIQDQDSPWSREGVKETSNW